MNENFADHPETVGEVRSGRNGQGTAWTPRDVLIHVLRKIDRGEMAPESLVVCWREVDEHNTRTGGFFQAAPDVDETPLPGETPEAFGVRAARWLEEEILAIGPEKVAAFIAEPVQGAGGVIIPPETYWPEIQRIVDQYGILLISDEVICAFGRLGHWFAYEKFGYRPDLVTFAKGVTSGYIPLGGVLVGERVARVLIERGGEFTHGYTYSGHPVACAVGLANLKLIRDLGLVERVRDAIQPDDSAGEPPLLPLLNRTREIGSTAGVEFRTKRPVFATQSSHISHVVDFAHINDGEIRGVVDHRSDHMLGSCEQQISVELVDHGLLCVRIEYGLVRLRAGSPQSKL